VYCRHIADVFRAVVGSGAFYMVKAIVQIQLRQQAECHQLCGSRPPQTLHTNSRSWKVGRRTSAALAVPKCVLEAAASACAPIGRLHSGAAA
jgi:hypothetical protein